MVARQTETGSPQLSRLARMEHGTINAERLVNRLIELGKPFDAMLYPNRTHSIAEGRGTTPHVYRLISRYFLDHLPPGPK